MPKNVYEFMFILDPSKVSTDMPGAVAQLHAVFEKYQCEILASRPWNEQQRLAYSIRNQKKGLYYLIYVRADSLKLAEIEGDFKLFESILRMLAMYIEPKWEEQMLAVAKDEHALALQVAREDVGDIDDYGPPRRGHDKD
jgi:ribosomal protein S6